MSRRETAPVASCIKIMALSPEEFSRSLAVLAPDAFEEALGRHVFKVDGGSVVIAAEPLAEVRLGGLLRLPQMRVTITFEGVNEAQQSDVLRRFEFAFQRGGG